jgi:CRP-like cAMP-binding protein
MTQEKRSPGSRLLDNFGQQERDTILSAASERRFFGNSVVTNQGHSADYMFFVRSGRARFFFVTEDGRKINLLWLVPGTIFGASALLSEPAVYLVSAETIRDSVVLAWDRATLRQLSLQYPRLTENALLMAWDYLAWYRDTHIALISHDARQRLAYVLATLARTIGQDIPGGIELDVTNEDLAGSANLTLFTVSRLLNEWQRKGSLVKKRGKVVLLDIDELSATWRPTLPLSRQNMPSQSTLV